MLLMINGTALLLVTVTVCAALVVLIGWFPNAIAGATVTVGWVVVPPTKRLIWTHQPR
jgi:hypothetical protein